VPAHSVYDDKKSSALMPDDRYPILIVSAIANEAYFSCLEAQTISFGLLDYADLMPRDARV